MKIARFRRHDTAPSVGIVHAERIIDLGRALVDPPQDAVQILTSAELRRRIQGLTPTEDNSFPLTAVFLEAPIAKPSKYLAIGLNYEDHAEEARKAGVTVPTVQVWFNKQVSCITGPFSPVHLPAVSQKVDYEAELGVVIGRRCRHVSVEAASGVIGGYFVANDVTARDWQQASPTWTLGKSFDTHGPIGPWIVTADEISDPHALALKSLVNGELRQQANTSMMIHNIYQQIAHLTTVMTLEPGDLIATGTCSGVGVARKPPVFLKAGDTVRVEIEHIGHIENTFVPEPLTPSAVASGPR